MATTINNTASATYAYGRAETASAVSNTATTSLIEQYAISGSKLSNNASFRNGENITYQISVSNIGTLSLYTVTISDDLGGLKTPLSYVDSSATLNVNGVSSFITPTSTSPLTFVLPSPLAAGETATITYVARVSSSLGEDVETIVNTASISANEGSTSGTSISVTPSPSFTLSRGEFANVTISKNVSSSQVTQGETFSYTLTLSNSGSLDATGVVITDTLPTGFEIESVTSRTNGVTTTFSASDYTVESSTNTLTLPTGSSLSITVPGAVGGVNGTTVITITGSIKS